jgi:hypothetical protein
MEVATEREQSEGSLAKSYCGSEIPGITITAFWDKIQLSGNVTYSQYSSGQWYGDCLLSAAWNNPSNLCSQPLPSYQSFRITNDQSFHFKVLEQGCLKFNAKLTPTAFSQTGTKNVTIQIPYGSMLTSALSFPSGDFTEFVTGGSYYNEPGFKLIAGRTYNFQITHQIQRYQASPSIEIFVLESQFAIPGVTVSGPNGLDPGESGYYSASYSGASSFKWYRDGQYLGTGSSRWIQMPLTGYQMVIKVEAFDSGNKMIAEGTKTTYSI